MVSSSATFSTRLMVANGIVMSKLCYLVQLWGDCEGYLLDALQVAQNRAARIVTRSTWFTSTSQMLEQCNWLSVRQLVAYQSLVMTKKTLMSDSPYYIKQKLSSNYTYTTRKATTGAIRCTATSTNVHNFSHNSFVHRSTRLFNKLPSHIRTSKSLATFKSQVKLWVKTNIPIT